MLTPDELLSTTRSVRRRLDLSRPVSPELIRQCVEIALQAPAGSNVSVVEFVVVTDPALRGRLAAIYAELYADYQASAGYIGVIDKGDPAANAQQQRSAASADYLSEHLGECPAIVIGCVRGRPGDGVAGLGLAGACVPAMWSFMLAARARGLGTAWTSMHLRREREIAELLGIPYERVSQFCLTPLAHTIGERFSPALRPSADDVVHWERW